MENPQTGLDLDLQRHASPAFEWEGEYERSIDDLEFQ